MSSTTTSLTSTTSEEPEWSIFKSVLAYGITFMIVTFIIGIAILYFFFKTIIRAFQIFSKIKKDKNPTLWWTLLVLLVLNITVIGNSFFALPFIFLVYLVYFHPESLKILGKHK